MLGFNYQPQGNAAAIVHGLCLLNKETMNNYYKIIQLSYNNKIPQLAKTFIDNLTVGNLETLELFFSLNFREDVSVKSVLKQLIGEAATENIISNPSFAGLITEFVKRQLNKYFVTSNYLVPPDSALANYMGGQGKFSIGDVNTLNEKINATFIEKMVLACPGELLFLVFNLCVAAINSKKETVYFSEVQGDKDKVKDYYFYSKLIEFMKNEEKLFQSPDSILKNTPTSVLSKENEASFETLHKQVIDLGGELDKLLIKLEKTTKATNEKTDVTNLTAFLLRQKADSDSSADSDSGVSVQSESPTLAAAQKNSSAVSLDENYNQLPLGPSTFFSARPLENQKSQIPIALLPDKKSVGQQSSADVHEPIDIGEKPSKKSKLIGSLTACFLGKKTPGDVYGVSDKVQDEKQPRPTLSH